MKWLIQGVEANLNLGNTEALVILKPEQDYPGVQTPMAMK
jgi:hypothetical protein